MSILISLTKIFSFRKIHREKISLTDSILLSGFLIYIIHIENLFSSSIIHNETVSGKKILRFSSGIAFTT